MNKNKVILIYNDESAKRVEVDRRMAAKSCFFLEKLLTGPFRESRLNEINIYLPEDISFECFKSILFYATKDIFIRSKDYELLFQMIQLARLWLYDELVDIIESHLADSIKQNTIFSFHVLARSMKLKLLAEKCDLYYREYEEMLGIVERRWGRCPIAGHEKHHYLNCQVGTSPPRASDPHEPDEDWDERSVDLSDLSYTSDLSDIDNNSVKSSI